MSSDLFVMEVAAWTASLAPSVMVPEIGGIVKFLNFKPFEFFRQVGSAEMNGKNAVYHIKKSKSALFHCNVSQLHSLLSTIPLYVVIAQWSQEDEKMERGQKLIGVANVSLTRLIPKVKTQNEGTNRPEIRTVSGLFPIRDLLGRAVGQIHLRAQLTEMNSSPLARSPDGLVGSPFEQMMQEPTVCRYIAKQSEIAYTPQSVTDGAQAKVPSVMMEKPGVQEESAVGFHHPVNNQTDSLNDSHDPPARRPQDNRPTHVNILEDQAPWTAAKYLAGQVKDIVIERPETPIVHHTTTIHIPSSSASARPDSRRVIYPPPPPPPPMQSKMDTQQNSPVGNYIVLRQSPFIADSVNSSPRAKVEQRSPHTDNELPILRSLLKELRSLRVQQNPKKHLINESELDEVYSLLSSKCSSFQTDARSERGGFRPAKCNGFVRLATNSKNHMHQPRMVGNHDRQYRVAMVAQSRKRLPPAGRIIPKDRGWLRATPTNRGSPRNRIIPRPNHAHLLRMKQLRNAVQNKHLTPKRPILHCDSRSKSVSNIGVKVPSRSQLDSSEQTDMIQSNHGKRLNSLNHFDALPEKPNLSRPSSGGVLPTSKGTTSGNKMEQETYLQEERCGTQNCGAMTTVVQVTPRPSPRSLKYSLEHRTIKSATPNKSYSKEGFRGDQQSANLLGKTFAAVAPQKSRWPPQVSSNQTKFVAVTRVAPRPMSEMVNKINLLSDSLSLTQDQSEIEEGSEVFRPTISQVACPENQSISLNQADYDPEERAQSGLRAGQIVTQLYTPRSRSTSKVKSEAPSAERCDEGGAIDDYNEEEDEDDEVVAEAEVEAEEEYDHSEDAEDPKPLSHKIAPMALRMTSDDLTDQDRNLFISKVYPIANPVCYSDRIASFNTSEIRRGSTSFDMTSLTRVTTNSDRRATMVATEEGSIDGFVPKTNSGFDVATRNLVRLPELELPAFIDISDHATDALDEFDIEAMRSRGSHDYILGGSRVS